MRLQETYPQNWRAVAISTDKRQHLLILGYSIVQVKTNYPAVLSELLTEDEKSKICAISLEQWHGTADSGQWVNKSVINIPIKHPLLQGV